MVAMSQGLDQDVLVVKDLRVVFHTYAGEVKALDGVDLTVRRKEVLGLVGESGSGKSVTVLTIEGLLPQNGEVVSGQIILAGNDLLKESSADLRISRVTDMAMVFQDPTTYLNPVLTVGSQITEIIESEAKLFTKQVIADRLIELDRLEGEGSITPVLEKERAKLKSLSSGAKISKREFKRLSRLYAINILRQVRLPEPERIFKDYPFELSGGMKQRAMIAMALVRRPKLFLADEITTALDVTVQAQILKLLTELREQIDTSVILITHDLAIVAEVCDRVAVMYAGNIVEVADVNELFRNPLHPYTKGLLASIPRPDLKEQEMKSIRGSVPNLIFPPSGCRFHPRCDFAFRALPPRETEAPRGLQGPLRGLLPLRGWTSMKDDEYLLKVDNLLKWFPIRGGLLGRTVGHVRAVDGVSIAIKKGETLGIVGESGCGKTTLSRTVMRLLDPSSGSIVFDGTDISKLKGRDLKPFRRRMQMVFQDPYASLDPRQNVRSTLMEPMGIHHIQHSGEDRNRAVEKLVEIVGLNPDHLAASRTSSRAVRGRGSRSPGRSR